MKHLFLFLFLPTFFLLQCTTSKKMAKAHMSDKVSLAKNEDHAVFLAINHVDILKIKGTELYHLFLIVLTRNPNKISNRFQKRAALFYNVETRDLPANEVHYFDSFIWQENSFWETTISASSECAYDTTAKKLGQLIKVPNFDRIDNHKSGKRVFVKKIASNNMEVVEKLLEFEQRYDNSLKYSLLPEIKKNGYNSNSYCRGALEYAGLIDALEVPGCFKSPGLSKSVRLPLDD